MLEEAISVAHRHKLALGPRNGLYETMPGDATLAFVAAILEEQWNLKAEMTVDTRTTLVKAEIQKFASPFAQKHIGLLEFVIPGLEFRRGSTTSMPPGSIFTVLVRMVAGFMVARVKEHKSVLVCDNAHSVSEVWGRRRRQRCSGKNGVEPWKAASTKDKEGKGSSAHRLYGGKPLGALSSGKDRHSHFHAPRNSWTCNPGPLCEAVSSDSRGICSSCWRSAPIIGTKTQRRLGSGSST